MKPELVEGHIEEPFTGARDDPAPHVTLGEPVSDLATVRQRVDVQPDPARELAVDPDPVAFDADRLVEAALDERARVVDALCWVFPNQPLATIFRVGDH